MFDDPILQEIRAIRDAKAAKFNYDVDAIFADLERRERESTREFASYAVVGRKNNDLVRQRKPA